MLILKTRTNHYYLYFQIVISQVFIGWVTPVNIEAMCILRPLRDQ
jgi:hypothetical protein